MIINLNKRSDEIGMLSSSLCIVHCLATPFILAAIPATAFMSAGMSGFWSWLDILFLGISFIAVYQTVKQSPFRWIRTGLIISFLFLTLFIINERYIGIEFPIDMVYIPAFALVALHLINRRQSRCITGECDTNKPIMES